MEEQPAAPETPPNNWLSLLRFVLLLVAGVFMFQSVAAKPFYIPSSSMMPTLLTGDRLVVSKYPYGFSYASPSIHGSAVIPGRLFGRLPERGDIVTVARRGDGSDLIKRVIGLPGDTVAVSHGVVILNGKPVPRVADGFANIPIDANAPCDEKMLQPFRAMGQNGKLYCRLPLYRETLPNGASYLTYDCVDNGYLDNTSVYTVPPGHFFALGDNRDNSTDSRMMSAMGFIPMDHLVGRVTRIFWSLDEDGRLRGERMGKVW